MPRCRIGPPCIGRYVTRKNVQRPSQPARFHPNPPAHFTNRTRRKRLGDPKVARSEILTAARSPRSSSSSGPRSCKASRPVPAPSRRSGPRFARNRRELVQVAGRFVEAACSRAFSVRRAPSLALATPRRIVVMARGPAFPYRADGAGRLGLFCLSCVDADESGAIRGERRVASAQRLRTSRESACSHSRTSTEWLRLITGRFRDDALSLAGKLFYKDLAFVSP